MCAWIYLCSVSVQCAILRGLLPQAPGECIHHLLVGGSDCSFEQYAKSLHFKQLGHEVGQMEFDGGLLKVIKKDWEASECEPRQDHERQIQPLIHNMLICAAVTAETRAEGREYIVPSEPSVEHNQKN